MALSGPPCGDAVATVVAASGITAGTPVTANQLKTLWENIMTTIYGDVKSNAVVAVASVSGVTTGGGTSGPGTGTVS